MSNPVSNSSWTSLQLAATACDDFCNNAAALYKEATKLTSLVSTAAGIGYAAVPTIRAAASTVVEAVLNVHRLPESPKVLLQIRILLEKKPIETPENRKALARSLQEFMREFELTEADRKFITDFCAKLNSSFLGDFDRLNQILQPHEQKHSAYLQPRIQRRRELETELKKIPGAKAPVLSKEQTVDAIKEEFRLLKSNSIKMILGSYILNTILGISNLDLTADLIQKTKGAENSDEAFKKMLGEAIDRSNANILTRLRAKIVLAFSDVVSSYVSTLFDRLQTTVLDLINLSSAQQLREAITLLVDPTIDHLLAIEKLYEKDAALADHLRYQNTDKIAKRLDELLKSDPTFSITLDAFVDALLKQFTDPLQQQWTRKIKNYFSEKIPEAFFVSKLAYYMLIVMCWIAEKVIESVQWTMDQAIRLTLKKLITNQFPNLLTSSKKAVQIGEAYPWYSLKKSLLTKVRQAELSLLTPNNDPSTDLPHAEVPKDITDKIESLLAHLKKVLDLQDGNPTVRSYTPVFEKQVAGAIAQTLLQEGVLSGIILSSLQNANATAFSQKEIVVEDKEKKRVHEELIKALDTLTDRFLQDMKEDSRTDRKDQVQANIYVNSLKALAKTFAEKIEREVRDTKLEDLPKDLVPLEQLHKDYIRSIQELNANLTKKVTASTAQQLKVYEEEALAQFEEISAILDHLNHPQSRMQQVFEHLEKLERLQELEPLTSKMAASFLDRLRSLHSPIVNVPSLEKRLKGEERRLVQDLEADVMAQAKDLRNILIRKTVSLARWANDLEYVQVTVKPTAADIAVTNVIGVVQQTGLPGRSVKSYAKGLFNFLGQECHIDGIVHRTLGAYTQKKSLPKQRIDQK